MCFELKKTCFFQSAMQKTEKKCFFVKMRKAEGGIKGQGGIKGH